MKDQVSRIIDSHMRVEDCAKPVAYGSEAATKTLDCLVTYVVLRWTARKVLATGLAIGVLYAAHYIDKDIVQDAIQYWDQAVEYGKSILRME